jgi:hypothetical protein
LKGDSYTGYNTALNPDEGTPQLTSPCFVVAFSENSIPQKKKRRSPGFHYCLCRRAAAAEWRLQWANPMFPKRIYFLFSAKAFSVLAFLA